jgi:hypothetical protein
LTAAAALSILRAMFAGLSDADFDAYLSAKQRSNVYNRERLEVKQRLLLLGRALGAGLTGPDGAPLDVAASVEHPAIFNHKVVDAQHVFFSRGEAARRELDTIIDRARGVASLLDDPTPQRSHVFLVVSVFADRLEVALRLHPEATVDRQNLLRKCQDLYQLDHLAELVRELGAGALVSLGPERLDAADATRDRLEPLLRSFAAAPSGGAGAPSLLSFARTHARQDAIAQGAALQERLAAELGALLPIYRFCAWSRDNDFVSVKEALQKQVVERRQRGLVRGDEIRVVRGLFSGQRGTVQEVDARGAMRVLVGKRVVKLDAADVERG